MAPRAPHPDRLFSDRRVRLRCARSNRFIHLHAQLAQISSPATEGLRRRVAYLSLLAEEMESGFALSQDECPKTLITYSQLVVALADGVAALAGVPKAPWQQTPVTGQRENAHAQGPVPGLRGRTVPVERST